MLIRELTNKGRDLSTKGQLIGGNPRYIKKIKNRRFKKLKNLKIIKYVVSATR